MLVLYHLESWEGKDEREGGRRIAEAVLSTLGEASIVVVVVVALMDVVVGGHVGGRLIAEGYFCCCFLWN